MLDRNFFCKSKLLEKPGAVFKIVQFNLVFIFRQRKLEEALLFSGQFSEAVGALLEWLNSVEPKLSADKNVHGDLDTVTGLVDQHKNFQVELKSRSANVDTVRYCKDSSKPPRI